MESRILIDAIVRQTTLLIAQLATSAGIRAPLANLADQVFLELSQEIEQQGVTRKVAADMFGMALRSYRRKVNRLRESVAEKTLWQAVLEHIGEHGTRTRSHELSPNHPHEQEVKALLTRVRGEALEVWQRESAYNAQHPPTEDTVERVIFYAGQNYIGQDSNVEEKS